MKKTTNVLLVEDNLSDIRLTVKAFEESKLPMQVHVARDGIEALSFLRKEKPFENSPRPDLILLDLNLPRMDGREALAEIKKNPEINNIPVIILSTSASARDKHICENLQADLYLVKPMDFEDFFDIIRKIEDFCKNLES